MKTARAHVLLIAWLLCPVLCPAQTGTAALTGEVTDSTGAVVPHARAELRLEQPPGTAYQSSTDALGVYKFSGLPSGVYSLSLSIPGFRTLRIKSLTVAEAQQKSIPPLELTLGDMGCPQAPVVDYIRLLEPASELGELGGTLRLDEGPLVGNSPPIPGFQVYLICLPRAACGAVRTDANGEFVFRSLKPGRFSVVTSTPDFYPSEQSDLTVEKGRQTVYAPIYLERCASGNCDPHLRPKKPPAPYK
jgi:hypothetical protein